MNRLNALNFRQETSPLPVFYSEKMVARIQSFSPSAGKPKAVVEYWKGLNVPICIHKPPPVARDDFYRAHDKDYVDDVLDLTIVNGFGNRSEMVAESLPYTSGAMLAAAREALLRQSFAIAPCSGFHHAGYCYGGGYCTFNGLMVTALALRADNPKIQVGILDFDQHYGDGTADIIKKLHLDWVAHYSAGEYFGKPQQAQDFLKKIPEIMQRFEGCQVLLYQAGADPHIDDPLGGWLTTAQLLQRDQFVFRTASSMSIPVAWNLAGGYQEPLQKVLFIHGNTLDACWDSMKFLQIPQPELIM